MRRKDYLELLKARHAQLHDDVRQLELKKDIDRSTETEVQLKHLKKLKLLVKDQITDLERNNETI